MNRIAVVGSGYMGGGIAQVFALAGCEVTIADVSEEVARANHARLIEEARAFEGDGLLAPGAARTIAERLRPAADIEDAVRDAEFIEEAVPEVASIKLPTLARISAAAGTDAIIGTNTSTMSIGMLAGSVAGAERFLGVHFSNPAPFIPGVEIIAHSSTSEAAVAATWDQVLRIGKVPARVNDATGFVLNRLQYALFHEATQLVEEGVASADDIDTIVRTTFGFRLPFFGPFAIADMAGLDVYANCYTSLQTSFPERFATPPILSELVEAGRLGTKSGGGFLDVPAERTPELVAYRNRAYARMSEVLAELGPTPIDPTAAGPHSS